MEGVLNQRNCFILEYNLYKFTHLLYLHVSSCCSASSELFSFSWRIRYTNCITGIVNLWKLVHVYLKMKFSYFAVFSQVD